MLTYNTILFVMSCSNSVFLLAGFQYSAVDASYQTICSNMAQSYKDLCLGFVCSLPLEGVPHINQSNGVPNVFYLVPASSRKQYSNGDASKAHSFVDCPRGVLLAVELSSVEHLDTDLPTIANELYKSQSS